MSKSFFKSVVMAAVFVIGAVLPLSAFAGQSGLDKAVSYYKKCLIDGFCHGIKISSGGQELPAAKRQRLEPLVDKFIHDTMLPVLKKHNVLDEWIKCQSDPAIIDLNNRAMQTTNGDDLQKFMVEAMMLMQKKYPDFISTFGQDTTYIQGYRKLTTDMVTALTN